MRSWEGNRNTAIPKDGISFLDISFLYPPTSLSCVWFIERGGENKKNLLCSKLIVHLLLNNAQYQITGRITTFYIGNPNVKCDLPPFFLLEVNTIESAPGILEFLALRWNNLTQKLISARGGNNTYQQLLNYSRNASNGKNQIIGVQLFIVTCFIGRQEL